MESRGSPTSRTRGRSCGVACRFVAGEHFALMKAKEQPKHPLLGLPLNGSRAAAGRPQPRQTLEASSEPGPRATRMWEARRAARPTRDGCDRSAVSPEIEEAAAAFRVRTVFESGRPGVVVDALFSQDRRSRTAPTGAWGDRCNRRERPRRFEAQRMTRAPQRRAGLGTRRR